MGRTVKSVTEVELLATALFAGLMIGFIFSGSVSAARERSVDLGIPIHERTDLSDWNTAVSIDGQGNTYVVFNDERLRVIGVKIDSQNRVTSGIVDIGVADDPGHNTPSVAVDGDGFIHIWYDMHNDQMKIKKSAEPRRVDAGWLHESGPWSGRYTYPAATVASNGDVYFTARRKKGWTCQLFHYDRSEKNWRLVADFAQAFGFTCYLPRPYGASDGKVHLSFQWRKGKPGANRHLGSYAVYDPAEDTFKRADGTPYYLPISPRTADAYQPLEANWENQYGISAHGLTVNDQDQPLIVYNYFRAGHPDQRVVRLARWSGTGWVRTDLAGPESDTTLGDADIVNRHGRINVFYNDPNGRLAWKQSVDGGVSFTPDVILTDGEVSSPWVHIGSQNSIGEEPVLICSSGGNTTCEILFVPHSFHPKHRSESS